MLSFSVVIPLFNKENDIKNTLESVLCQSYSNFEIIIVDDGSTDNSLAIVNSFDDIRIRLLSKENEGVSIARNFGVEKSNSKYIAFLDADDFWYANHLENLKFLINQFPNYQWYASAYEKNRTNKLTTPMNAPIMEKGTDWSGVVEDFFENCFVDSLTNSSNTCFKNFFFQNLNGFNQNFTHGEDTDLWIRAALKSPLVFSNKITSQHNLLGSNRSSGVFLTNRKYFNIDAFSKEEKNSPSLKKYLDLNRYSQVIKHQLSGDKKGSYNYRKNIDSQNLNSKQQFLLKQSKTGLLLIFKIQKILEKLGVRVSSF